LAAKTLQCAALLFLCAAGAPLDAHAVDVSEIAARVKPSVVHLAVLDASGEEAGNGTGFFISASGWIVTNHHVIEHARAMRARLADGGERRILGVLADDEKDDVAIIQAEGQGYPALELAEAASVKEGAEVVVIGSPLGLQFTISQGNISALRLEGMPDLHDGYDRLRTTPIVQITAPITFGSSGSPVVNFEGRVVGVAQSIMGGRGEVGFAIFEEVIRTLRASITPGTAPVPLTKAKPLVRNLLISAAFFGLLTLVVVTVRGVASWKQRRRSKAMRRMPVVKKIEDLDDGS
jgi:serine protease Do